MQCSIFLALSALVALLIPSCGAFISTVVGRSGKTDYQPDHILHAADAAGGFNGDAIHDQRNIVILCHNVSQDIANGIFDINNLLKGRMDVLARCVTSALWVSNNIRVDTTVFLLLFPHNITIEVQGSCVRSLTPDERTMALYLQRTLWSGKYHSRREEVQEAPTNNIIMSDSSAEYIDSFSANKCSQTPRRTYSSNPQSAPMSDEKRIRDMQKGRDAMVNRIRVAHQGKSSLPGFILHHDDTLQARLNQFVSMSSGDDDDDDDDGRSIYMLSENGDPLWDVLEDAQLKKSKRDTKINNRQRTTTLILGNQQGYSVEDEKLLLGTPSVREVSLGSLSLLTSQCITITHHYLDRFE